MSRPSLSRSDLFVFMASVAVLALVLGGVQLMSVSRRVYATSPTEMGETDAASTLATLRQMGLRGRVIVFVGGDFKVMPSDYDELVLEDSLVGRNPDMVIDDEDLLMACVVDGIARRIYHISPDEESMGSHATSWDRVDGVPVRHVQAATLLSALPAEKYVVVAERSELERLNPQVAAGLTDPSFADVVLIEEH